MDRVSLPTVYVSTPAHYCFAQTEPANRPADALVRRVVEILQLIAARQVRRAAIAADLDVFGRRCRVHDAASRAQEHALIAELRNDDHELESLHQKLLQAVELVTERHRLLKQSADELPHAIWDWMRLGKTLDDTEPYLIALELEDVRRDITLLDTEGQQVLLEADHVIARHLRDLELSQLVADRALAEQLRDEEVSQLEADRALAQRLRDEELSQVDAN